MLKQSDMTTQASCVLETISKSDWQTVQVISNQTGLSNENCEFLLTQFEIAGFVAKQGNSYMRTA
ncbi:hypothetical protein LZ636_18475 [Proteus terrae]|uniref:hypothetical protein n=1 Tax=Proteus TaxID=583 RepID=UPI00159799FE|nr:hypothetical protein [Proteus terrae]QKJ47883.1 hypothetical protein G9394_02845 [Proteus vulgaris]MCE9840758.1 hypothetical protein [Proteus terrae]MCE9841656.1 hypothetical protein [Proteus terrae]MCO4182624.1 hypothetical protein [Proteus terrae]MCO4190846.1 hypothetical protein [Proteus terrae]